MANRKAPATQTIRLRSSGRPYPGVQGKVVDYISHSIDDGTLCVNVCFTDKTLFSLRFACEIFMVVADLSDWKTGNFEMIREYMKPIPRRRYADASTTKQRNKSTGAEALKFKNLQTGRVF